MPPAAQSGSPRRGAGRTASGDTFSLVGDVGATNARFGIVSQDGTILDSRIFACADFAGIGDAIEAYLAERGGDKPRQGALAIAAAIAGDGIKMTNHPWSFTVSTLRDRLGFD